MIEREIIIQNKDNMPGGENPEAAEKDQRPHGKKGRKKAYLSLFMVCVLVFGICLGTLLGTIVIPRTTGAVLVSKEYMDKLAEMGDRYAKLEYLRLIIDKYYFEEPDEEALLEGAYKGMFGALDQYSEYMTPEEYENFVNYTNSVFVGIGVLMTVDDRNQVIISGIYENSPALRAGLKEGDIIKAVDGKAYSGDQLSECSEAIRKEEGQVSSITYIRGGKEYTKDIVCAPVETGTVFDTYIDYEGHKIGYIRIYTFGDKTADEFEKALRDMEVDGTEAFILDLRSNGGGEVKAATAIADRLLPECLIMTTKSRVEGESKVNSKESCTGLPFVVLVNSNSASASEILAAAIKGNHAAPIVGETTYGKGVLQTMGKVTKNGSDAFKITYAEYFGPGDMKINEKGIKPDYEVKLSPEDEKDAQVLKALELAIEKCD